MEESGTAVGFVASRENEYEVVEVETLPEAEPLDTPDGRDVLEPDVGGGGGVVAGPVVVVGGGGGAEDVP